MGDVVVPISQSVKYLGVTLTSNLKFTKHIDETLFKGNRALAAIRPVLKQLNGLAIDIKLLCYR